MRYEASYNGRVIDVEAEDEQQAVAKALHRFQAIRRLVNVWPKRLTPVSPATTGKKV
jgi:hypothetical protein